MRVERLYQAEVDAAEASWQRCEADWAAALQALAAVPGPGTPLVGTVQAQDDLWAAARFEAANAQKRAAFAEAVRRMAAEMADALLALQATRRRLEMAVRLEARAQRARDRVVDRRAAQQSEDDWRMRRFGAAPPEGR